VLGPLIVAAVALLAASVPEPGLPTDRGSGPAGAVLDLAGPIPASGPAGSSPDAAPATAARSTDAPAPILDRRSASSATSGRGDAPVVQSAPKRERLLPPSGSTVVFLGDSYTSGWNGAGLGANGWPAIVDRARGWKTVNLAVPGTGFVNPGWTGQPVRTRVSAAISKRPAVVFLATGHNDSRWSAATIAGAADSVIDRLHRDLPDAVLVIVAPIWPNGRPPTRCLVLRDHLRRKAASVGAIFVDPLAEGWFAGASHRFIGGDGIHPTNAGHRHIADRVLADLASAD
jgi:lysophospholipase L1-like esterase